MHIDNLENKNAFLDKKERLVSPTYQTCINITVVAVLLFASSTVSAADFYVTKSGSDSSSCGDLSSPCETIMVGVENAEASPTESTVFVGPGTYMENVVISSAGLTILSIDGRDVTVIDANSSPRFPSMR